MYLCTLKIGEAFLFNPMTQKQRKKHQVKKQSDCTTFLKRVYSIWWHHWFHDNVEKSVIYEVNNPLGCDESRVYI